MVVAPYVLADTSLIWGIWGSPLEDATSGEKVIVRLTQPQQELIDIGGAKGAETWWESKPWWTMANGVDACVAGWPGPRMRYNISVHGEPAEKVRVRAADSTTT